jgi:hypothetical protein
MNAGLNLKSAAKRRKKRKSKFKGSRGWTRMNANKRRWDIPLAPFGKGESPQRTQRAQREAKGEKDINRMDRAKEEES